LIKKRTNNKAAGALSRVSGAELLPLVISKTSFGLLQGIEDDWTTDVELKGLIEKLQADPHAQSQFSWHQNQLRRKGRVVVGKGKQLKQDIMTLWHATCQGGHYGNEE